MQRKKLDFKIATISVEKMLILKTPKTTNLKHEALKTSFFRLYLIYLIPTIIPLPPLPLLWRALLKLL